MIDEAPEHRKGVLAPFAGPVCVAQIDDEAAVARALARRIAQRAIELL